MLKRCFMAALAVLPLALPLGGMARAQTAVDAMPDDWWACVEAANQVEELIGAPEHLLTAIALNETGRRAPNRQLAPWPWTINVGGQGYEFATKEQAVFAARQLLSSGIRSFDVGCMQVNVRFHPRAFTSFDEAFDPLANVLYAADYLERLQRRHGSWTRAVELYHSYTEEYNQIYGARFETLWDLARRRAARGDVLMAGRPPESGDDEFALSEFPYEEPQAETAPYTLLEGERASRSAPSLMSADLAFTETPLVAALLASYHGEVLALPEAD